MSLRKMFKFEFDPGAGFVVAMLCITAAFAACEMATTPHILVDEQLEALPECPERVCPEVTCPPAALATAPPSVGGALPEMGSGAIAAAAGNSQPVDLNHAGPAELARLPGVGPGTAQRIIDYRGKRPFRRTRDVMRVRGIGRGKYLKIKPFVRVTPRERPVRHQATGPR
jgi:hypothetical protein